MLPHCCLGALTRFFPLWYTWSTILYSPLPSRLNLRLFWKKNRKKSKKSVKKQILDPNQFKNNRHVLNLPCPSKLLKQVILQLTEHVNKNNLTHTVRSAYRSGHSMETARLRVFRDLLLSADIGNASVLTLLDLSAAFDAIDRHITLDRVQNYFGISGPTIDWFQSCLSDRHQN